MRRHHARDGIMHATASVTRAMAAGFGGSRGARLLQGPPVRRSPKTVSGKILVAARRRVALCVSGSRAHKAPSSGASLNMLFKRACLLKSLSACALAFPKNSRKFTSHVESPQPCTKKALLEEPCGQVVCMVSARQSLEKADQDSYGCPVI